MARAPSDTWRSIAAPGRRRDRARGLDAALERATGAAARAMARAGRFTRGAERTLAMEAEHASLTDAALRARAEALRAMFRSGSEGPEDVARAFAIVREAARRAIGLLPHPVQVAGALALEAGCVAEMATGEGKTLVATMPAVAAGWRGRGMHIVTVNDYLARRDAEWMRPVYELCGVSVAWIEGASGREDRRAAYDADVTYCTNKELAADFLRDRLSLRDVGSAQSALVRRLADGGASGGGQPPTVMRGLSAALVDEADSVLIDEAITPLIIAGEAPNAERDEAYRAAARIAAAMAPMKDFRVDRLRQEVSLTPAGREVAESLSESLGGVWSGSRRREELITQALFARELSERGRQYLIRDGRVVIVDDFTGRLMPDRTWRDGLHQAIEAKESLDVRAMQDTLARVSFQRFFGLYRRLSGMTGTAREEADELWATYGLPVVSIPTHRPCRRVELADRVFRSGEAKWRAVAAEVGAQRAQGRATLIGVRSVAQSEALSGRLKALGLEHHVLNAERHAEEARIIARAGEAGAITIATNMAGRGTDIRLGDGVAERGGLHVIAAERQESRRVDRQLFGRAGRQGDPGSAQAMVSLEDDLVARFAPRLAAALARGAPDELAHGPAARAVFALAQRRAGRLARQRRRSVLRADDWLDEALGFAGAEW